MSLARAPLSVVLASSLASLACTDDPSGTDEVAETGESESGDEVGESSESDGSTESSEAGSESGEPLCTEGPWNFGAAIPMEPQTPGDPELGRHILFHDPYVACGVPWDLFNLAKGFMGSMGEGEALAWREGKNAEVPYSWTVNEAPDGSEYVSPNCLQCHGGEFDGELIIGLGRHDLDMTSDLGSLLAPVGGLPALNDAGELFNKFIERYSAIGSWSTMATVGTNSAIMYAVALVNHRNPYTLAWLDEPTQPLPPNVLIASDAPPWWRVKKKAAQFANGMSRGDHRGTMILASSLCTDSAAEAAQIVESFAHINAYLATIEAPEYPREIDMALADEGKAIFECECSGCHGTYDEDSAAETYPNLLIPLEVIGTDDVMAGYAAGQFGYLEEWFNESYYGTVTTVETADPFVGYVAPPLDGIWATAPYFHNGSVPSIELVLDSSKRPTYWKRVDFESTNYDWDALGWPWLPAQSQDDTLITDRKYVYDTTLMSMGNAGHTFGDHLSDDERAAVLEYLKTL